MKDEFHVIADRLIKELTEAQTALYREREYPDRAQDRARLVEAATRFLRKEFGRPEEDGSATE